MNDSDLVVSAFAALYERHVAAVYGYLARRVGADVGEELTAETFLQAFAARDRFDLHRGSEESWLFGIAINLLRHHYRHEERTLRAVARVGARVGRDGGTDERAEDDALDRLVAEGHGSEIAGALAAMTPGEREVLLLYVWAHLPYGSIASTLDLPIGTVRSRMSRARARLATSLGPWPVDELRGTA